MNIDNAKTFEEALQMTGRDGKAMTWQRRQEYVESKRDKRVWNGAPITKKRIGHAFHKVWHESH